MAARLRLTQGNRPPSFQALLVSAIPYHTSLKPIHSSYPIQSNPSTSILHRKAEETAKTALPDIIFFILYFLLPPAIYKTFTFLQSQSAMAAPSAPLNLCTVLNESKRIVNAHSRHFLALSVLFLLPLCFSSIVYPTVQNLLTDPSPNNSKIFLQISTFNPHQHQPIIATKPLCIALSFFLFIFVFSLCAVGSITYSVFHGFYGRPVKLISAIKSVLFSFFPLLGTVLVSQILVLLVFTVFGLVLFLVVRGAELMGFQMEYNSPYFIGVLAVLAMALFLVLLYLQVNWTLASVVVVVESNWGFGSLTRSTNLIKGMRGVALSLMLFFGFFLSILGFCSWASALDLDGDTDGWKSWAFVVQIVVTSTSLMLLMLYNTAANTVLYMYCRALNGELAMEIAEEFATEYVSLPFDVGKVPHLVSVAYT